MTVESVYVQTVNTAPAGHVSHMGNGHVSQGHLPHVSSGHLQHVSNGHLPHVGEINNVYNYTTNSLQQVSEHIWLKWKGQ